MRITTLLLVGALSLISLRAQVNPRGTSASNGDFPVRPLREVRGVAWEIRPGFRDFGHLASAAGVIVTGNTSGKGGVFAFDAATGKILWTSLPGRHLKGEPFVDNESAWVVTTGGGSAARLTSHALKTGVVRWSVEEEYLGLHEGGPVSADGRVFLLSQNGKVKAWDAKTGKPAWELDYATGRTNCRTALALSQGVLYFGGGDSGRPGSRGEALWALDAATGKERWRFLAKPDGYNSPQCVRAPAVADGVVVTSVYHMLYAVDATTGAPLWSKAVEGMVEGRKRTTELSDPIIAQGAVYATTVGALRGWNLRTGAPELDLPGVFRTEAAIDRLSAAGGVLYFAGEPAGQTADSYWPLHALDLKTKQILWKHRTNRPSRFESVDRWPTRWFLPMDGAVLYQNESILVKLQ